MKMILSAKKVSPVVIPLVHSSNYWQPILGVDIFGSWLSGSWHSGNWHSETNSLSSSPILFSRDYSTCMCAWVHVCILHVCILHVCVYVHMLAGNGTLATKDMVWGIVNTWRTHTSSSYVLTRCQEVAKNMVTALLFASTIKHRWNGKQNNLLFLLLLCK